MRHSLRPLLVSLLLGASQAQQEMPSITIDVLNSTEEVAPENFDAAQLEQYTNFDDYEDDWNNDDFYLDAAIDEAAEEEYDEEYDDEDW
mmetsp:Transcript_1300/g.1618  ORF Transcript_1300/g.1618 Transcript_1300/m.1618 type:complete len:89 (-) Transcript_1300:1237-1503(-)